MIVNLRRWKFNAASDPEPIVVRFAGQKRGREGGGGGGGGGGYGAPAAPGGYGAPAAYGGYPGYPQPWAQPQQYGMYGAPQYGYPPMYPGYPPAGGDPAAAYPGAPAAAYPGAPPASAAPGAPAAAGPEAAPGYPAPAGAAPDPYAAMQAYAGYAQPAYAPYPAYAPAPAYGAGYGGGGGGAAGGDSAKLFVGSLPIGVSNEELAAIFAPFGELNPQDGVHVLPPKGTRGQGCGFVKFQTQEAAWAAVAGLHDKVVSYPSFPQHADPMLVRFADSKAGGKGGEKRPRFE